jgi:heavy metal sensor kinase
VRKARISLRWRLILLSGSLAVGIALVLTVLIQIRSERQLLDQLEKTLETKCDEVITVLESAAVYPALEEFLLIETDYRFSPYTYFYQIGDGQDRILMRSENLGSVELPLPEAWREGDFGSPILLQTVPHPLSPGVERIRLRSERLEVAMAGEEPTTRVIQTAISLGPFDLAVGQIRRDALLGLIGSLAVFFFLLWFVTTRALLPVSAMTRKASQITATNLRERLPLSGRGDELDELASALNDMLDRLGGSLRQMEQFSSDVAHQLRTSLTRMRGELDLILRGDASNPSQSQLERIQEELERLSRVCQRLLLLARLDQQAGDVSFFNERVDLEEVVSELLEQMAPVAQDRGIQLRRGATSPMCVRGSRPLLVEALLNLLDNAIRFTPEGGLITLSIGADGDMVSLSVEDNGQGIPPDERERIFQRFYQIPPASAAATDEGSGLGLAMVRGIARAHGGRVEFVEAPGTGSIFRLVLPHPFGA